MDLEEQFKKETGFTAYIDNDLTPKIPMNYYVEWLEDKVEKLTVTHSSTLLKEKYTPEFEDWLDMNNYTQIKDAVFKDENGKKFKQTVLQIKYYESISL